MKYTGVRATYCTLFRTPGSWENGQGVIDLQEVFSEEPISYEDTQGLAYSVKDLEEWAESGWGNEDTENILICTKKDGGEEYLYFDEFNDKIRSGELRYRSTER